MQYPLAVALPVLGWQGYLGTGVGTWYPARRKRGDWPCFSNKLELQWFTGHAQPLKAPLPHLLRSSTTLPRHPRAEAIAVQRPRTEGRQHHKDNNTGVTALGCFCWISSRAARAYCTRALGPLQFCEDSRVLRVFGLSIWSFWSSSSPPSPTPNPGTLSRQDCRIGPHWTGPDSTRLFHRDNNS